MENRIREELLQHRNPWQSRDWNTRYRLQVDRSKENPRWNNVVENLGSSASWKRMQILKVGFISPPLGVWKESQAGIFFLKNSGEGIPFLNPSLLSLGWILQRDQPHISDLGFTEFRREQVQSFFLYIQVLWNNYPSASLSSPARGASGLSHKSQDHSGSSS